ncbi:MAG: 50S ribosomal protein L30 [Actinomycetota bacterium]
MATLRVTLRRSRFGPTPRQRATLRALGLRRIRQQVDKEDRPEIRGMLQQVRHLIDIEEVKG